MRSPKWLFFLYKFHSLEVSRSLGHWPWYHLKGFLELKYMLAKYEVFIISYSSKAQVKERQIGQKLDASNNIQGHKSIFIINACQYKKPLNTVRLNCKANHKNFMQRLLTQMLSQMDRHTDGQHHSIGLQCWLNGHVTSCNLSETHETIFHCFISGK